VGILAVLLSGGSVVVASGFDRRSFWAEVERTQATWLNLAPAMIISLAGVPGPDAVARDRVRFARVAGAALPPAAHSKFWQSTGISLVETYTLTEAAGPVAANPLDLAARRLGSVGLAGGVEVRIVDDEGRAVPVDTTGWIQVRGDSVVTHYLSYGRNRSSLPAQDADGWLHTGEVGYRTCDGYLYLVGREVQTEAEGALSTVAGF
jgi:acyl-CoA synthetase (AMP-forming)/AMP-acid ligase II